MSKRRRPDTRGQLLIGAQICNSPLAKRVIWARARFSHRGAVRCLAGRTRLRGNSDISVRQRRGSESTAIHGLESTYKGHGADPSIILGARGNGAGRAGGSFNTATLGKVLGFLAASTPLHAAEVDESQASSAQAV